MSDEKDEKEVQEILDSIHGLSFPWVRKSTVKDRVVLPDLILMDTEDWKKKQKAGDSYE